jgi:hypothetical protein
MLSQNKVTTITDHKKFLNIVDVITYFSGSIGVDPGMEAIVAV